jgi:hypothetical protein
LPRAVQISRFPGYLDGLNPLLSISMSAMTEAGSALGTLLSKLAPPSSRGPMHPQVLEKGADFGPLRAQAERPKVAAGAAAVQIGGVRKPNLDKPAACRPLFRGPLTHQGRASPTPMIIVVGHGRQSSRGTACRPRPVVPMNDEGRASPTPTIIAAGHRPMASIRSCCRGPFARAAPWG